MQVKQKIRKKGADSSPERSVGRPKGEEKVRVQVMLTPKTFNMLDDRIEGNKRSNWIEDAIIERLKTK